MSQLPDPPGRSEEIKSVAPSVDIVLHAVRLELTGGGRGIASLQGSEVLVRDDIQRPPPVVGDRSEVKTRERLSGEMDGIPSTSELLTFAPRLTGSLQPLTTSGRVAIHRSDFPDPFGLEELKKSDRWSAEMLGPAS